MNNYPATLNIDNPRKANRLTVFFRLFMTIPIMILLGLLSYHGYISEHIPEESYWVGILVVPALLMIVFRRKYPNDMFNFVVVALRWVLRVEAYALLLTTDQYPPFRLSQ